LCAAPLTAHGYDDALTGLFAGNYHDAIGGCACSCVLRKVAFEYLVVYFGDIM
jgi:hypothetical protein